MEETEKKEKALLDKLKEYGKALPKRWFITAFSGMAQGVAAAIDSMGRDDVVGSVAGDDTIIIVMRTNEAAALLAQDLAQIIKK